MTKRKKTKPLKSPQVSKPIARRGFTITVQDDEFFPIVKRELEWSRDHIIEAGADYCRSKRRRDALVRAFNLVIGEYTSC